MDASKRSQKGGVLEKSGIPLSTRRATFYSVCIPVRLGIAGLVYYYSRRPDDRNIAITISLLIGLIGMTGNLRAASENNKVWWHRHVHAVIFLVLVLFAVLAMYKIVPAWTLAAVLAGDAAFGFVDSFISSPFYSP